MDYQGIAKECIQDGLQIPEMVLEGNPTNTEIVTHTRLLDTLVKPGRTRITKPNK